MTVVNVNMQKKDILNIFDSEKLNNFLMSEDAFLIETEAKNDFSEKKDNIKILYFKILNTFLIYINDLIVFEAINAGNDLIIEKLKKLANYYNIEK